MLLVAEMLDHLHLCLSLAHFGTHCKLAQIKAKPMAKSLNQTKVNTRKEKEK
jgi:hypothetical protein